MLAQFSYFMVVQIQFYSRRCILQCLQIQQTHLKNNQCYRTSEGMWVVSVASKHQLAITTAARSSKRRVKFTLDALLSEGGGGDMFSFEIPSPKQIVIVIVKKLWVIQMHSSTHWYSMKADQWCEPSYIFWRNHFKFYQVGFSVV